MYVENVIKKCIKIVSIIIAVIAYTLGSFDVCIVTKLSSILKFAYFLLISISSDRSRDLMIMAVVTYYF